MEKVVKASLLRLYRNEYNWYMYNPGILIGKSMDARSRIASLISDLEGCSDNSKLALFSVFDKNSTIGQRLLGLEYPTVGKQRLVCLFVLDRILPYVQQKNAKFTTSSFQFFWNLVENCVKACQLINLLTFLLQNRYPSLSSRIAGIPMKSVAGKGPSNVGYSYQIRELLWHQFADILMVILPLINTHALMSYFSKHASTSQVTAAEIPPNSSDSDIPSSSVTLKCCYCNEDPTIPTKFGHCTFCYFCLKANQKSDPNFTCTH